jgi:asparaginyl-tRNA synthetase
MTRHHLAEFYMLEAELIDMNQLDSLLDFTEALVKDVALNSYKRFPSDLLASFNKQPLKEPKAALYTDMIKSILEKPFVRITYSEAVVLINKLLKGKQGRKMTKKSIEFGEDLNKEQEKLLVSHFENVPVFVTHYPTALKPFYMRQNIERPEFVDNFDLLAPFVGEIVGGSLREYRLEVLREAMKKQGLDVEAYGGYLETKKFGGMRMGGFGLGLERFMQFLLNIENIRDTCAFPRSLHHCKM